jgi:hypothetical protein
MLALSFPFRLLATNRLETSPVCRHRFLAAVCLFKGMTEGPTELSSLKVDLLADEFGIGSLLVRQNSTNEGPRDFDSK